VVEQRPPNGKNFEDLIAWQRSTDLVDAVYRATKQWPPDERFMLIAQIRRAVVSIRPSPRYCQWVAFRSRNAGSGGDAAGFPVG
jgi:hypothetical protein